MRDNMLFLVVFSCLLHLYETKSPPCKQNCTSDIACKGFLRFSPLNVCVRGCCTSQNTFASEQLSTNKCMGDIEDIATPDANAYPWLAYIVQTNGESCTMCTGVLVHRDWVATDDECFVNAMESEYSTTVFFNLDSPYLRQVYTVVGRSKTVPSNLDMRLLRIKYVGLARRQKLKPVPITCNEVDPTEGTVMYWSKENDEVFGTRIFNTHPVTLRSKEECKHWVQSSGKRRSDKSNRFYCVAGAGGVPENLYFNRHSGIPLLIKDGAGNHTLVGMFAFTPEEKQTTAIVTRVSQQIDQFKENFNVTCST